LAHPLEQEISDDRAQRGFDDRLEGPSNLLFAGGYEFMDPPPLVTKDGVKPFPTTGARKLNARASFFYLAIGITTRWIKTVPGRGWFAYIRIYGPEQAAFDGSWKPDDIEEVK
jgi:hypothetical protein